MPVELEDRLDVQTQLRHYHHYYHSQNRSDIVLIHGWASIVAYGKIDGMMIFRNDGQHYAVIDRGKDWRPWSDNDQLMKMNSAALAMAVRVQKQYISDGHWV